MKRTVTPAQHKRLARWAARKPVIAVMGEFSSGKSSLINLLTDMDLLPTQVTATRLPPIWMRYGSGAPYRVDQSGRKHPVDWSDMSSIPLKDTRYIRLYCQAEILERCDLIDTPGISDPSIPARYWIDTVGYAHAVLWCTHAGQAWRASERGAWTDLPKRLRDTSILLVTRKDRLKSQADLRKVDRRLSREAGELFNARAFISLTGALAARRARDVIAWEASGAKEFHDKLSILVHGIGLERSHMLKRYVIGPEPAPAMAEPPVQAAPATPKIDDSRYLVLRNAVAVPDPAEADAPAKPFLLCEPVNREVVRAAS